MCVQPFLVLEERAKQQRNLPVLISFDARRKRAGIAHDIAPMLNEIGSAVQRSFKRQITSNRRHGCHLSRSPGDAGGGTSMLLEFPIRWSILLSYPDLLMLVRASFSMFVWIGGCARPALPRAAGSTANPHAKINGPSAGVLAEAVSSSDALGGVWQSGSSSPSRLGDVRSRQTLAIRLGERPGCPCRFGRYSAECAPQD
jgi:hypothetical protein